MRKIRRSIFVSYTANVLLVSLLFLLATYFFLGKNLGYLTLTQKEINTEIGSLLKQTAADKQKDGDVSTVLQIARQYNVGLDFTAENGRETVRIPESQRILRLEFLGRLVSKEISLEGQRKAVLTYFQPFFASDNTVKFFPAFFRLAFIFVVFALTFSAITALANTGLLKNDVRKVRSFSGNLVKGSFQGFQGKASYLEFQEIINELNSLRDILLNKEQLKKRMTSDLAHEIRTPLTTLQSHLEALIDGVWQPTTERFISCHDEILRLIRLAGDLEKLSKVEDENIVLEKTSFNLTELVSSISLNFQGQMSAANVSFTLEGREEMINADRDKISQVIVNLLSNSLKYTGRYGRILIDIRGDRDHVCLVVNDSGMGIPANDLPNVFNRLYRSDASRTRETGGAGIGLTIAKSIVEAHRGSIEIVSQEKLGTEVTVIIPRH